MLPFEIPFLGDYLAGFTLLMGLSMVVTMRLQSTPGSGAQAQLLMYGMPVFIFFIFNQFASALSLYYLFYNIVTAAQQKWINYQLEQEEDLSGLETNGKNGKSRGFLGRLMDAAEEAREQQK
jgi:YidC/Oxa1 family membrane protein insertase